MAEPFKEDILITASHDFDVISKDAPFELTVEAGGDIRLCCSTSGAVASATVGQRLTAGATWKSDGRAGKITVYAIAASTISGHIGK